MDWIGLILFVMWFLSEKDLLLLFAFLFLLGDRLADVLEKTRRCDNAAGERKKD